MKKTVLITGCNRGLGKAFMNAFAADGYDIIAMVRNMSTRSMLPAILVP